MGITNSWRNKGIFISMILMLTCLFVSRAALSVSMILFFALTLVHKNFAEQLRSFSHSLLLVSISVLFFIPLFTVFWSNDLNEWSEIMRIKLPLLFFPLAFAGRWTLTGKQWNQIAIVFLVLMVGGCCWSLILYFQDTHVFNLGYLKAKLINTPLENDHVRFSWLVSVAIMCCFLLRKKFQQKPASILLICLIIFFVGFLHILAARMGLFCLYVFLSLYIFRMIFKVKSLRKSIPFLGCFVLIPLLAWLCLPTFQNRIRYFLYDISNVQSGIYLNGSNDGIRVLSLRAGWDVMTEHPFGVGAGDLRQEVNNWYSIHAPKMLEQERFLPISEWLVYAGFGGWLSLSLLLFTLSVPFFKPLNKQAILWYCLNAAIAFSFAFDMSIEAQFGVFIYAFLVLWWWKWLNQPDTHE